MRWVGVRSFLGVCRSGLTARVAEAGALAAEGWAVSWEVGGMGAWMGGVDSLIFCIMISMSGISWLDEGRGSGLTYIVLASFSAI